MCDPKPSAATRLGLGLQGRALKLGSRYRSQRALKPATFAGPWLSPKPWLETFLFFQEPKMRHEFSFLIRWRFKFPKKFPLLCFKAESRFFRELFQGRRRHPFLASHDVTLMFWTTLMWHKLASHMRSILTWQGRRYIILNTMWLCRHRATHQF